MALSRLTTWSAGQLLTAIALNNEFDNILNNPLSLISTASVAAKGLLLVGNGSALTGVSVGTDNQVLTADSTQASGVKWTGSANVQTPWATNINAAGYTLYGSTQASGNLVLDSTTSGTKGYVVFNSKISAPLAFQSTAASGTTALLIQNYASNGTSNFAELRLAPHNGYDYNNSPYIRAYNSANDAGLVFGTYGGSLNERMRIDPSGNVGIGMAPTVQFELSGSVGQKASGTTWSNPSDRRLKDHITPFTDGLSVLTRITPVSYTLNGLAGTPKGQKGISVIAQDLLPVAPYTIDTYKAKLHPEDAQETDLYRFEASALTFVAINAIKELDARLTALESRNV